MVGVTSSGVIKVITDPKSSFSQSLNAILTAELTDNAGWELLIELASELGQKDMLQGFEEALMQENIHLTTIKSWLKDSILQQAI